MKKTLSIIAMCFMLQGCFYQSATQFDIYRASRLHLINLPMKGKP